MIMMMKWLCTYWPTNNNKKLSQQTNEQTKVIQEVVTPEVSKLNHTRCNEQKARRSNAVFSSKKTRKKKMNSSNPSYQPMVCVVKLGIQFINSRHFFIYLKIFILQEKTAEIKRMGCENWYRFSDILAIVYVGLSAMCVWWSDWFKIKMSNKAHIHSMVVLCQLSIGSYLVYMGRYQSVIFVAAWFVWWYKWMCHALSQRIRTIKTFIKYKSATADKFITKNHK